MAELQHSTTTGKRALHRTVTPSGAVPGAIEPRATPPAEQPPFDYDAAFARNLGWFSAAEQQRLRHARVAIAGMGGVGGAHLLTLTRLGVGSFSIADPDCFETVNSNRQTGAFTSTYGRAKVDVMAAMALDINPELDIRRFLHGVDENNMSDFLDGCDLFVDGLDFFVLDVRRAVFARCRQLAIPAITAAPVGMGVAYLTFTPDGMSFEEYFRLDGLPPHRQYVNFLLGLTPKGLHRTAMIEPLRVDLAGHRGPSTAMACQMAAGVVGTEAAKLLTGRGQTRAGTLLPPVRHLLREVRNRYAPARRPRAARQARRRLPPVRQAQRLRHAPRRDGRGAIRCRAHRGAGPLRAEWRQREPWRFAAPGEDRLIVTATFDSSDIFDIDGHAGRLAVGALLESIRLAASTLGRAARWSISASEEPEQLTIEVSLPKDPSVEADPLAHFLRARSVDRRRYRTTPLSAFQHGELARALGPEFGIRWMHTPGERFRAARLNARATALRLSLREVHTVHRRVVDWHDPFSTTGIPAAAIGLDCVTLRAFRWSLAGWRRMWILNKLPASAVAAQCELDILPGLSCGAHFVFVPRSTARDEAAMLRYGAALQRFWLTATRLGLVVQPTYATIGLGRLSQGTTRTRRKAAVLAEAFEQTYGVTPQQAVFSGRIGVPTSRAHTARSLRRPLAALLAGIGPNDQHDIG